MGRQDEGDYGGVGCVLFIAMVVIVVCLLIAYGNIGGR